MGCGTSRQSEGAAHLQPRSGSQPEGTTAPQALEAALNATRTPPRPDHPTAMASGATPQCMLSTPQISRLQRTRTQTNIQLQLQNSRLFRRSGSLCSGTLHLTSSPNLPTHIERVNRQVLSPY